MASWLGTCLAALQGCVLRQATPPICASVSSLAGAVRSGTRVGQVMSGSARSPQHGQGRLPTWPRPAVPRRGYSEEGDSEVGREKGPDEGGRQAAPTSLEGARAEGAGPEGRAVGGVLLGAGRRERACVKFPCRTAVVTV